jgi:hypothetical protein
VKDVTAAMRKLRRAGYDVTKGRHWKVRDGNGRLLAVVSGTTSDRNSLQNLKRDLRRAESGRD